MNKEEVIQKIGEKNWEAFCKFMRGQTVQFKDGREDFYEWDVQKFININRRRDEK